MDFMEHQIILNFNLNNKKMKDESEFYIGKLVPTLLCMCMYSIIRTNLLLWFISCFVVRSTTMATRQNKYENDKVKK